MIDPDEVQRQLEARTDQDLEASGVFNQTTLLGLAACSIAQDVRALRTMIEEDIAKENAQAGTSETQ